jgi:hypothetical protein
LAHSITASQVKKVQILQFVELKNKLSKERFGKVMESNASFFFVIIGPLAEAI